VARFGYRAVMTTGLVLVAFALLGLARLQLDTPLWLVLVFFFVFGFGLGNVIAPGSTVMQNVLPLARAGAGSAVQNTVRQVAGALGVAVVGTLLATRYAANLNSAAAQSPVPVDPELLNVAQESIVAADMALTQAGQAGMPGALIDAFRSAAYDSFLNAAHLTSYISAAVVVIAALLVAFLLPAITPPQRRVEQEEARYSEEFAEEIAGGTTAIEGAADEDGARPA